MEREPHTEEPDLEPGGADMSPNAEEAERPPLSRDLPPEANPAAEEAPDEVTEPDEKSQDPDTGTSGEGPVAEEPPA